MGQLLRNRKILIIDDAPDVQTILRSFLEQEGAIVEVATNGSAAIQNITEQPYDLALLDLNLPEMSGYEIAQQMRHQGFKSLIYAFTAHDLNYLSKEKLKTSGFSGYLSKDFIDLPLSELPKAISEIFLSPIQNDLQSER
ncbi:MAG: response regulator [Deltaproteobacteria bacterium]|nr:response regulator [Deltaproteobacteria bacterium]